MEDEGLEEITKRLDAIIALLVSTLSPPESPRPLREQIGPLNSAGLGPAHIGRILGKPAKDVASELARIRAKRKTGKRK